MLDTYYPLPAFYFTVSFTPTVPGTASIADTSFQEVTGISAEIHTEEVFEGGNPYSRNLPKSLKFTPLKLKRGVASKTSGLVTWCHSILDPNAAFTNPIKTMSALVSLMDEKGTPVHSWTFVNAYPVKWTLGGFDSTKSGIAIEEIELKYEYFTESTSAANVAAANRSAAAAEASRAAADKAAAKLAADTIAHSVAIAAQNAIKDKAARVAAAANSAKK